MNRYRENDEYAAMLGRMIRAAGRRFADADPEDLPLLLDLREQLDEAIGDAVRGQRSKWGVSWAAIGDALGMRRQSAQEKYGRTG